MPCTDVDGAATCERNIRHNRNFCSSSTTKLLARASCCQTCCYDLGFTKWVPQRREQYNGYVFTVLVNIIDLSSQAAIRWAEVPKIDQQYPGLSLAQSLANCNLRSKVMGVKNFCKSSIARVFCGLTCLSYNYPDNKH